MSFKKVNYLTLIAISCALFSGGLYGGCGNENAQWRERIIVPIVLNAWHIIPGMDPLILLRSQEDPDDDDLHEVNPLQEENPNEEALYAQALEYTYLGEAGDLRALLDRYPQIDVNHIYENGDEEDTLHDFTLLHQAALNRYTAVVQLLLERGAEIRVRDREGNTSLHLALMHPLMGDASEIVTLLASYENAPIDIAANNGRLPLHYAARNGFVRSLRVLLVRAQELGITGFQRDREGQTFVHHAAEGGRIGVIRLWADLIRENRLDEAQRTTPVDNDLNTPLSAAARAGQINMIPVFAGSIESGNVHGEFAIHIAARAGHLTFVRALVENHNAKLSRGNCLHHTPLHIAVIAGHIELVHYFLERGLTADLWLAGVNEFGPTPIELARKHEHADILEVLLRAQ